MPKPIKPNINLPEGFAENGQKADFPSEKLDKGFDPVDPDVLSGDNLNKFIDDTYKGLNYAAKGVENIYQQGIPLYDNTENYPQNAIVKAVENSSIVLYQSLSENNTGNSLADKTKWKKVELGGGGSSLPLFFPFVSDRILEGNDALGWALQGSLVTDIYTDAVENIRAAYENGADTTYRGITCKRSTDGRYIADIFQKEAVDALFTNSGIADFYILDSENNQFYLPRSNWFQQLTLDTSLVNNFNEAGLPNVTGDIYDNYGGPNMGIAGYDPKSALYYKHSGDLRVGGTGSYGRFGAISLNLSANNSVYKDDCDTVQPPSSNKLLYYKVGNIVVSEGQINIGQALSDLQLKADKLNLMDMIMPDWKNKVAIAPTLFPYTCPKKGWFEIITWHQSEGAEWYVQESPTSTDKTLILTTTYASGNYAETPGCFIPVDENNVISSQGESKSDNNYSAIYFIPCKGG